MNWREAAFFIAILIVLTMLVSRDGKGQEEPPPPSVRCAQGQCLISVVELRMLVQRASLCGWEAK